eukprot:CAMPEP_0173423856 /NCGR_PEP_ID=MMETSP1357-20121228/3985_1 /TAXON_ID=77926 /ORGANISM="Hemiselmis rufescens, Strain PCC563" /LENGTH=127 /DNA_ID=CAMNT_0014387013 /DNA_START=23 /DNA_END=405 /DNA_ORIENTATION=-
MPAANQDMARMAASEKVLVRKMASSKVYPGTALGPETTWFMIAWENEYRDSTDASLTAEHRVDAPEPLLQLLLELSPIIRPVGGVRPCPKGERGCVPVAPLAARCREQGSRCARVPGGGVTVPNSVE